MVIMNIIIYDISTVSFHNPCGATHTKATGTYGLYAQIPLVAQQEPLSLLAWEAKEMFLKKHPMLLLDSVLHYVCCL